MGAPKRRLANGTPKSTTPKNARIPAQFTSSNFNLSNITTTSANNIMPGSSNSIPVATSMEDILGRVRALLQKADPDNPLAGALQLMVGLVEAQSRELSALKTGASPASIVPAEDPAETKERARSIVIAGITELAGKPSERRQADGDQLVKLFDELDVEAEVVATYRMGVRESGKKRLIKVVLGNSGQQRAILAAARKLKNSVEFKGVFLRPSMTKEERDEDYALRRELAERRRNGENVRIKGWPGYKREIVSVNSHQGN